MGVSRVSSAAIKKSYKTPSARESYSPRGPTNKLSALFRGNNAFLPRETCAVTIWQHLLSVCCDSSIFYGQNSVALENLHWRVRVMVRVMHIPERRIAGVQQLRHCSCTTNVAAPMQSVKRARSAILIFRLSRVSDGVSGCQRKSEVSVETKVQK